MYTINFIAGDTYTSIPDKTTLIEIWTQELFHNVNCPYKIFTDEKIIIDGLMNPEDLKILEQLQTCDTCQAVLQ